MTKFLRTSLLLPAFLLWGRLLMAQPANDHCADAIPIGTVQDYGFTSVGATTDGPYHPADCTGGAADSLFNDVWYLFTADFSGTAEFSTCSSASFDTNIAVYAPGSSCPPEAGDLVACNEDGSGCSGYTSKLTFSVQNGQAYLLRIGGWGPAGGPGESGEGTFSVGEYAPPVGPPNNDCANAIAIGSVQDYFFTTVGATTDGPYHPSDCTGGAGDSLFNDIWYLFTADFSGTAEFTTCNSANFDTNVAVYAPGSACPPENGDLISCNEDGSGCSGYTSKLTFDVVTGQAYLLRIGGWGSQGGPGESGSGTFTVGEYDPPAGPPNDECDNAIQLDLGAADSVQVSFSTIDANTSEPYHQTGPAGCLDADEPVPYNDIWYVWTATFTGYVEYSNCGTATFDSKMAVYGPNPSCPPTTESLVVCGDDGCPGFTSVVLFPVEKDSTYLFRMGGWSIGDAGNGVITVKRVPPPVPPSNDLCIAYDSAWVTPVETADEFDPVFTGFTSNGAPTPGLEGPSCVAGNEYTDVWYKFNSGDNTQLTLRLNKITAGSQFAVELFDNCGALTDTAAGPGFCFYTYDQPGDFVTTELTGFPGVPTEYLLRISTDLTYDQPGEFFFQILGNPFVNAEEAVWEDFSFWPNPVADVLQVQFRLPLEESLSTDVLNSLGQVVLPLERNRLAAGLQQLQVPLSGLPQGVYFLRLQGSQGQKTVRFVKS